MVFMHHEAQGKLRKLVLPHHGPYSVLDLTSTGATPRPVDQPTHEPILVNLDRITKCSSDLPDVSHLVGTPVSTPMKEAPTQQAGDSTREPTFRSRPEGDQCHPRMCEKEEAEIVTTDTSNIIVTYS